MCAHRWPGECFAAVAIKEFEQIAHFFAHTFDRSKSFVFPKCRSNNLIKQWHFRFNFGNGGALAERLGNCNDFGFVTIAVEILINQSELNIQGEQVELFSEFIF